eukprot:SAG11_NODE_20084_length_453_cov_0.802260_1_plen_81_part_10
MAQRQVLDTAASLGREIPTSVEWLVADEKDAQVAHPDPRSRTPRRAAPIHRAALTPRDVRRPAGRSSPWHHRPTRSGPAVT